MSDDDETDGLKTATGCLTRFAGATAGFLWGLFAGLAILILAASAVDLSPILAVTLVVIPAIASAVWGGIAPTFFGEFALELILSLFRRFS